MKRYMKFRAWDKEDPLMGMLKVRCIDYHTGTIEVEKDNGDHYSLRMDCFDLMQYTGIKDKNGTEIYEGDIIQFQDKEGKQWTINFEVGFWMGCFALANLFPKKSLIDAIVQYNCSNEKNFEIIGNIHENPELLN